MSTATLRDTLDTVFTDGDWLLDIAFCVGDENTPDDLDGYVHYLTLKRRTPRLTTPATPILLTTEDDTLQYTAPNLVGPRVRTPQLGTWDDGVYDVEQSWLRPDGVTEVVLVTTVTVIKGLSLGGSFAGLPLPSGGPSITVVRSPSQARVVRTARGPSGWNGWTAVLSIDDVTDPPRRLMKVIDWAGGGGEKPTTGAWAAPGGLTVDPDAASDFGGASTAATLAATAAAIAATTASTAATADSVAKTALAVTATTNANAATTASTAATADSVAKTALAVTATTNANAATTASTAATADSVAKTALAVTATTNANAATTASTAATADSVAKTALAVTATTNANAATTASTAATAAAQTVVNNAAPLVAAAAASATAAAASAASAAAVVTGGTASLVAAAGKIPLADGAGKIDRNWLDNDTLTKLSMLDVQINHIGLPGQLGFGVGICPTLTAGYTALAGTYVLGSDEYGNYRYSDGSIMVWVPAFYARVGHAGNPTYGGYGVNSVDVKPLSAFPDRATAILAGYNLPRAFIDGGEICPGFMFDKYQCSNSSGKASSIKLGAPLSSAGSHNPFSGLTGAPSNNYGGAFAAAKTRGSQFFPASRFQFAALAMLALGHGQAATSSANCAWYDAALVINFPKGNNNGALKDQNDNTVTFTSDGYTTGGAATALTGSASNLAKTTHNGQVSGIADVNGNMYMITPGLTCVATSKSITAATQTNPVALTIAGHGLSAGPCIITNSGGMTQLNDRVFTLTVVDANTVTLDGVNGTAFGAYTAGGLLTVGQFQVAKEATKMKDFTGGNTLATDHFGATGVAAMMQPITLNFRTDYSVNGIGQRFGNGADAVLDNATEGDGWLLRGLGLPKAGGMSAAGVNLFGQDYHYQHIRNELCLISGGYWSQGTGAGPWSVTLADGRSNSFAGAGFRVASFPVRPSGNEA